MNPVFDAAFRRAALLGALLGIIDLIKSRQFGLTWEECVLAGILTLAITLVARGLGEGGYDSNRATNNNINDGDVPVAAPRVDVVKQPGA